MPKDLVINQTPNECRAALVENGENFDYHRGRGTVENNPIFPQPCRKHL